MQRLVTKQDLIDNPELQQKGVSVNQYYNFPDDYIPSATTTDTDHYEITEETVPYNPVEEKKKTADKPDAKKKPTKQ